MPQKTLPTPPITILAAKPPPADLPLLAEPRRAKLWDLAPMYHCSIIGTCLTPGELRSLVGKVTGADVASASDIALHNDGVRLASDRGTGGKLLQKALDRRHHLALKRFAKAADAGELTRLWDEAKRNGDIPGAYWAVLTHPAATPAVVNAAFADVHMLSHLVGSANRADIRRLAALEHENAELHARAQRTEEVLRAAIRARDARLRDLNALLAERLGALPAADAGAEPADPAEALRQAAAQSARRLSTETARRERAEQKLADSRDENARIAAQLREAEARCARLAEEVAAVERHLDAAARPAEAADGFAEIAGSTLLYVGGRPGLLEKMQTLADKLGLTLLHHDGGVEDNRGLLAGKVSRADAVMFPVDCISHDAVGTLKRVCRQADKPYLPLRGAGMASFVAGLAQWNALRPSKTVPG